MVRAMLRMWPPHAAATLCGSGGVTQSASRAVARGCPAPPPLAAPGSRPSQPAHRLV